MAKFFKIIVSIFCYYLGIVPLFRFLLAQRGVIILAYHRVNNERNNYFNLSIPIVDFEIQLQYLVRHYNIISLGKAIHLLKSKQKISKNTVVITFDDGYQDNYINAFPIMRKYQIPATIFLVANPICSGTGLWYDFIKELILKTSKKNINLKSFGLGELPLDSIKQKKETVHKIVNHVKNSMRGHERDELLIYLKAELKEDNNQPDFQNYMLTWKQIKRMKKAGITFGAHTLSHPILTKLSPQEAKEEIRMSKSILEKEMGEPIFYFAYPNGGVNDFNETIINMVKKEGFQCACTLIPGVNKTDHLFSLRRLGIDKDYIGISGHFTKEIFATEMAGIFDLLLLRFLRR